MTKNKINTESEKVGGRERDIKEGDQSEREKRNQEKRDRVRKIQREQTRGRERQKDPWKSHAGDVALRQFVGI